MKPASHNSVAMDYSPAATQAEIPDWVMQSKEPVVLRGLVAHWPIVAAAKKSAEAVHAYLRQFDGGATVSVATGEAAIAGRIFYNDELTGFNFEQRRMPFEAVLNKLQQHRNDPRPPVFYVGSTSVDYCLPGFRKHNDLDVQVENPLVSLWLGNQTRIPAHYDIPHNIACVVAGKRRFTLFPPSELENLYIGPLDFAPAGQSISLVDVENPDLDRFPKFRHALEKARRYELAPGDAIFIPSMWWHHVSGLEPLNALINYWWRNTPPCLGLPMDALHHALLSIRDLPVEQRRAWQNIFNHYVFDCNEARIEHIPEKSRGVLSAINEDSARRLRALLIKQLNR